MRRAIRSATWAAAAGTEHCAGWGDYGFHLREALRPRALALFPLLGAVIGTASWLLTSWLAARTRPCHLPGQT